MEFDEQPICSFTFLWEVFNVDVWTWIYIVGLVSFVVVAVLHAFVGIFDSFKHGKLVLVLLLSVSVVLILVGLAGSHWPSLLKFMRSIL